MFAYGASDPLKVEMIMYPAESEDFAGKDSSKLDTFVFDKFEEMLKKSRENATLYKQLHSDRICFFLHLLGIDTNGHSHRPYSKEYLENIRVVDNGLKKVEKLLKDYYQDDKTAFIVTSDHGMSNRGSHGEYFPYK
jgi:phosphatidylinositol glycan class N